MSMECLPVEQPDYRTVQEMLKDIRLRKHMKATVAKPDLVFRLGFAGNRKLPEERKHALVEVLAAVYEAIGTRLKEIAPGVPIECDTASITRFYSDQPPLLRFVSGLAEGADELAVRAFVNRPQDEYLRQETAGVLPFDCETYRNSRDPAFQATFDELEKQCAYVLQLDGIYDKSADDSAQAKRRRARAYRAQATLLLRHCDMMLVVADPTVEGKAGGTLETIERALDFEIPVLLVDSQTAKLVWFEPGDDLDERLIAGERFDVSDPKWVERVCRWVTVLVADPEADPQFAESRNGSDSATHAVPVAGEKLVAEFFADESEFPRKNSEGKRRISLREKCWQWFQNRFKPREKGAVPRDHSLEPFAVFRNRATELNYHYSGLYRGTFVLNYLFAVLAVTIATFSLLLMGQLHSPAVADIAETLKQHSKADESENEHPPDDRGESPSATNGDPEHKESGHGSFGVWLLLGLALVKLALVFAIYRNTHNANHGAWNDKAIDWRYLAERLRASFYLPRIGSFQPPAASQPQFASRVLQQSSIDWLLDAIVRSVSPRDITELADNRLSEGTVPVRRLRVQPLDALASIRAGWLDGQIAYHTNNALTMNKMNVALDVLSRVLNLVVIVVVCLDVSILMCDLSGLLPNLIEKLHHIAPFLVFSTAVLPAAVAGLNGIRFQSECRRLADRSHVMQRLLQRDGQRAKALAESIAQQTQNPDTDLGSWTPDVLRIAEAIAREMVEEVAEWSVVYAKELAEP